MLPINGNSITPHSRWAISVKYPDLFYWGFLFMVFAAVLVSSGLLCKEVEIRVFNYLLSSGTNGHTAAFLAYLTQVLLIYDVTLIALTALGLRALKISKQDIGWVKPESFTKVFASVLFMIAFIFLSGILSSILKTGAFNGYTLGLSGNINNLGLSSAYIVLFVKLFNSPIEEVFYRGFLQTALAKKAHVYLAITITALLFAVAHIESSKSLGQIFFSGLVYGALRNWGGSLWNPIAAHFSKNFIASYITIGYR